MIPTRFPASFGDVFPYGVFILGVEPSFEFQEDRNASKRQERDRETNQLVWTVRALDANEEAARFVARGRVAYSFRATRMRAPGNAKAGRAPSAESAQKSAA
jgi:hypothetical protein